MGTDGHLRKCVLALKHHVEFGMMIMWESSSGTVSFFLFSFMTVIYYTFNVFFKEKEYRGFYSGLGTYLTEHVLDRRNVFSVAREAVKRLSRVSL